VKKLKTCDKITAQNIWQYCVKLVTLVIPPTWRASCLRTLRVHEPRLSALPTKLVLTTHQSKCKVSILNYGRLYDLVYPISSKLTLRNTTFRVDQLPLCSADCRGCVLY